MSEEYLRGLSEHEELSLMFKPNVIRQLKIDLINIGWGEKFTKALIFACQNQKNATEIIQGIKE